MSEVRTAEAPWYVSGTRTRHNAMPVLQIISEPSGEVLALVPYSDRTPKAHAECYADARLIAAAPALLSALQHLEDVISGEHVVLKGNVDFKDGALEVMRAAIAKATGSQA